ncbi:MAG TPA: hypothetical protein VJR29_05065 [bacterium]|nr:hypothetical protein [bacterium]
MRGPEPAWLRSLDSVSQREWRNLVRETDAELYQEGLLHFAGRQERLNQEAVAGAIYNAMLEGHQAVDSSVLARARERLAVLNGGGSGGARTEYLLRHAGSELFDPSMIAGMGAASAVFRLARAATLARLASGAPGFFTRGWAARGLASAAGFALEAPTFTLAHRLGRAGLGHSQDWSVPALTRDFASSYLVLGAMKLGARGAGALQGLGGYRGPAATALFQQSGMLGGILISQGLERRLGWRPAASTEAAAADALVTWLQFNMAGRLSQSVLGPRFQAWERELESRTRALELPRPGRGNGLLENLSPQAAWAGTTANPRFLAAEPLLPMVVQMSSNKPGRGSEGPTDTGRPEPTRGSPETASPESGARKPFFSVEVPRGGQALQYRLVLQDFDTYLRSGSSRVIAIRDDAEIRLRLIHRTTTRRGNDFLPAGLKGYIFEISEGPTRGEWHLYATEDGLMHFSLRAEDMKPGVAGIVMDWMATQAALTGRQALFAAVTNVEDFAIIKSRGLIDERSAILEAHQWGRRHRRQSIPLGRFGDADFISRHRGGYFNLWAFPRPTLLPPELRSAEIPRQGGADGRHSYELHIEPLRRFFTPGYEGVIARREGREIRAKVFESCLTSAFDRFMATGTPRISLQLWEGEPANSGQLDFYVEPHRLSLANIARGAMPPGAGSIVIDWLYTQAAVRGAAVDILHIKNPRLWETLEQHRFFERESAQVELGHWDTVYSHFEPTVSGAYGEVPLDRHYREITGLAIPVAQLRSRPNLARLPEALRPTPPDTESQSNF